MTVLLFVLFFVFCFVLGSGATLLVVAAIVRDDVRKGEGLYVTYSPINDRWSVFGDVDSTLNKMRSHHMLPDTYDRERLEAAVKARREKAKAKSKRRWYRK